MKKAAILVQVLALLTLISLLPSCKTIADEGIVHINLDDALENPSDFKLSDIVKDVEIISLDTVKEAFFGNAGGLTITDNYICFACDQQKMGKLMLLIIPLIACWKTTHGSQNQSPMTYMESSLFSYKGMTPGQK